MRKYRVTFQSGRIYSGTPKEIVTQLRNGSMFDRDKPLWIFMQIMSNRHRKYGGEYLNCLTYGTFVRALKKSEITAKFEELN